MNTLDPKAAMLRSVALAVLTLSCASRPGAGGAGPEGACASDRDRTEQFATSVRRSYTREHLRPNEIVPVYDSEICRRAIDAYLRDDKESPPGSRATLRARVLRVGQESWAAIISPDEDTWHWFDLNWQRVGVHVQGI
jgi:hypothetical protein